MSEWRTMALGDVCELKRGYDLPKAAREQGSIPIVSSSGVTGYHSSAKVAGPGVITGRYGTLGQVFFVRDDFWPLNTALYVRNFKGNEPRFVAALLESLELGRSDGAAAVPGVNRNHLHGLPVVCPDLSTQRQIALVLEALDGLAENNRRRIELLEQMAQAIYREWFVHFRYPGHEDASLVDSPLGPIPQGWNVRRLGELAGINVSSRKPRDDETVRYLDISCLGDRSLIPPRSVEGSQAPGRARRVVRAGDVVWSLVRPNRRAHALLVEPGPDWIASTGLAVLTAMHVSSAYLFEAVSELRFSDHLTSQEGGSAYPAVKPKDFEAAVVLVPSPAVDHQFAELVGAQHRLVWTLRAHSEKLASLRDLLLPGLVTGRIDVSELNLDAVAESVA